MNPRPSLIIARSATIRLLAAALLAGSAALEAPAQNVTSSYAGPPPPIQPSRPETFDTGPSLGPGGRPMSRDNLYPHTYSPTIYPPPSGPFFLPLLLPVLGADRPASSESLAANYPRDFAGEPFLMAYGNLAANHQLSAKRAASIDRYRATRLALLAELRAQLARAPAADVLSGLAAAQTPRLLELEAEAEQIRHDLTRVELFSTPADDIGKLTPIKGHPNDVLGAVRLILSAAHFQDGFSLDQRRLLEEMAQEVVFTIEPEPVGPGPGPVFFWPAGARLPAPTGLPPEVAARFEELQQRKAALKAELRATLDRENSRLFNTDSTETYARLAAAQAPRFAELDALADQLRPALAADNASEHRNRQPDYAAAVLITGLSPAQRRLLLTAAAGDSLQ